MSGTGQALLLVGLVGLGLVMSRMVESGGLIRRAVILCLLRMHQCC